MAGRFGGRRNKNVLKKDTGLEQVKATQFQPDSGANPEIPKVDEEAELSQKIDIDVLKNFVKNFVINTLNEQGSNVFVTQEEFNQFKDESGGVTNQILSVMGDLVGCSESTLCGEEHKKLQMEE